MMIKNMQTCTCVMISKKCKWLADSLDLSSVVTSNMILTKLNSFLSLAQGLCPCTPPLSLVELGMRLVLIMTHVM